MYFYQRNHILCDYLEVRHIRLRVPGNQPLTLREWGSDGLGMAFDSSTMALLAEASDFSRQACF
jgi:hypothetical protein